MSSNQQINLLTDAEVEELYARPRFNEDERDYYFELTDAEKKLVGEYTSLKLKVYLILQMGYFKSNKLFYKFSFNEAKEDVDYIIKKYFNLPETELSGTIWEDNYRKQKFAIRKSLFIARSG